MKKTATIYRSLLHDAWLATWQRKSLWVFGIFAAFLYRGSVMEVVFSGLHRIRATGSLLEQMLDQSFIGYRYISQFLVQLQKMGSSQFAWLLAATTLVAIGLICAGVISQAALMHASRATTKNPREIRRHVLPHFFDVFVLNVITKTLSLLLIVLVSLPVFLFLVSDSHFSWIVFVHLLVYIPVVIFLHIFFMLTLADIVTSNVSVMNAMAKALKILKTHWLSAIEFGLILFLLVLGAHLLFAALLTILSVPYGLIYRSFMISQSFGLFLFANSLTGFMIMAITLVFAGAVTTFQYSAWQLFYKRASHHIHGRNPFAKIWRCLFA